MNKFSKRKKPVMSAAFFPQATKVVMNKPVLAAKKRCRPTVGLVDSAPLEDDVDDLLDSQASLGFLYSQSLPLTQEDPEPTAPPPLTHMLPTAPSVAEILDVMRYVMTSINGSKVLPPFDRQKLKRQGKRFLERMEKVSSGLMNL